MKYSVEKDIMRYPEGTETAQPKETVSGVDFYSYDLGGGLYVWRTRDRTLEVGRRGGGGTYYGKVLHHILEATFLTVREAMRKAVFVSTAPAQGKTAEY